jgi:hypothetical protein
MRDSSPRKNTPWSSQFVCDVCGSQSVFVAGAGVSLCSRHAQLSIDHGWLPVGSAADRQNRLKEETVY